MTSIVLDTNALLMPFQFDINLDLELERLFGISESNTFVPSSVQQELRGLGKKAALKMSEKYSSIEVEKKGDEGVLEAAEELDGVIVTNDKDLKKRALARKIPVAYLRSKSHLELAGEDWLFSGGKNGIEERGETTKIEGKVTSGVNEGQYFLGLKGYKSRFKKRFGFEPFEGTLNVMVKGNDLRKYEDLKKQDGETIKSFEEDGKRFGEVKCFPCELKNKEVGKEIGHDTLLIMPEKTRYEKIVEIVSKYELRKELNLEDEDEVSIFIKTSSEDA